jgi:putative selenium metabolism protein SsnA
MNNSSQLGDLFIKDGLIDQVGKVDATEPATVIDARGGWVVPGLIDAHTHLYGALAHGMPLKGPLPRNFPQVLNQIWWKLDKALSPEDIEISAFIGGMASLRAGVTTIFDHHASPTCPSGSLQTLSDVVGKLGLRASLAYEVSDRDGSVAREAGMEENIRFIKACIAERDPMRRAHFGLHAVFSLSDKTLRRCAEIGNDLAAGFHLHVLEHRTELEKFVAEHAGLGVVPFLESLGILGSRTIAAHTVHIDEIDTQILAQTGTWTVHNPKSNMGNGVGVSPLNNLLKSGVHACLGSDGYYDLPQQMSIAPLLQNLQQRNPGAMGTREVLKMVFQNNAALAEQTFGLPFGRLAAGYAGDCLVIPYEPATPVNTTNLGSHLMAALTCNPTCVIVGGAVRMQNGEYPGLNAGAIFARSRELATRLWERM